MKIGDKYGDGGFISAMEKDLDKPLWIHVTYPDHDYTTIIKFQTTLREQQELEAITLAQQKSEDERKSYPLTYAEYAVLDKKFKELRFERDRLEVENRILKKRIAMLEEKFNT